MFINPQYTLTHTHRFEVFGLYQSNKAELIRFEADSTKLWDVLKHGENLRDMLHSF